MQIFKKTSLKLTGLYLLIIMFISLSFSVAIFQVSVRELDRVLKRQRDTIVIGLRDQMGFPIIDPKKITITNGDEFLNSGKVSLVVNLIFVNLAILAGGGILSYYLARRTLKPIEEAHEAQKRFTADASHELRTPIAAMQTEIEVTLMDKHLDVDTAKKQLASNLEELSHLTSLTEGLLRLARLEDNDLQKSPIEFKSVIKLAIDRVESRAIQKNITINFKAASQPVINADKTSLEEAIITILDNAIKYSPEKSQIEVSLSKEGSYAKLVIKDFGTGISKQDLPHIFERFYQSNKARCKGECQGYGLGLAIAKKIVNLHLGKLSAESNKKSTSFKMLIPMQSH